MNVFIFSPISSCINRVFHLSLQGIEHILAVFGPAIAGQSHQGFDVMMAKKEGFHTLVILPMWRKSAQQIPEVIEMFGVEREQNTAVYRH